jgi:L-ribulose-5-phosphate 3-epimerase UlaE
MDQRATWDEHLSTSKVAKFDHVAVRIEEQVLRLDISVTYSSLVYIR